MAATGVVVNPVRIKIPYGETQIPAGTRVEVLSSDAATVRFNYLGGVQTLPAHAVNIESGAAAPAPINATQANETPKAASIAPSPSSGERTKPAGSKQLEAATYVVKTEKGSGSAFLVRMGESNYVVTNYHVLCGARTVELVSSAGRLTLDSSSRIEVAADRDLVRIPVEFSAEVTAGEPPALGAAVKVYGNPGGQQVVTEEAGKLLGVGQTEIEVSANFIPGNSGGPIVQADSSRVIGIATYLRQHSEMEKWVTSKTRFEEARRFGVRLDGPINWSPTTWSQLSADTALIARDFVRSWSQRRS